nr:MULTISPECIES: hypothetical protein [unclassified Methanopyrus]
MLSPETVVTVNTVITSLPFLATIYVVVKRPARTLIQLYSFGYLAPVAVLVYGLAIPVPGNLYAYFTGAPIFLAYGVTDALIVLYALGSALAVIFVGIDQWADIAYSASTTVAWLLRTLIDPMPSRLAVLSGVLITTTINALVAWYKYQAWPIVPLPSVALQFSVAVASVVMLEVTAWWVLNKLKPSPQE